MNLAEGHAENGAVQLSHSRNTITTPIEEPIEVSMRVLRNSMNNRKQCTNTDTATEAKSLTIKFLKGWCEMGWFARMITSAVMGAFAGVFLHQGSNPQQLMDTVIPCSIAGGIFLMILGVVFPSFFKSPDSRD